VTDDVRKDLNEAASPLSDEINDTANDINKEVQ